MIELSSLIRRYSSLTEDEKIERDTRPVLVIESPLPEDLDKVGGQTMSREQYEAWQQAIKLVGGKKIVPIFGAEFVIGRDDANLQIPDPSISRRHIAIRQQEDGTVVVTDLGSSHGTLVNAEPLPPHLPRILSNRDRVMVGKVTITYFDGPTFRELVEKVCRKIQEASA